MNERSEWAKRKENNTMRDPNTANYYALLIAILCNESAREALKDMAQSCSAAEELLENNDERYPDDIECIEFNKDDQTAFIDVQSYYDEYDNVITAKALAAIDFVLLEENQMKARFSLKFFNILRYNNLMEVKNKQ